MAEYKFVTVWHIPAPVEAVWNEISHPELWPSWWRGVERVVELEKGDARGVGSLRRYTWKSLLPYRLTFDMRTTRVEPMSIIEGIASGELEGRGRWQFAGGGDAAAATHVRYDWEVRTTKRWMSVLSPLARPLFEWNHDVVMGWGAEGLQRKLGAAGRGMSCGG